MIRLFMRLMMVLIMVIWFTGVNSAYQFLNDCMNDGLTMETTGAGGGNNSIGGTEQRPGIRVLDPTSNKTTTLLNNYFGFHFNGLDDLFVDSHGDIWFADPHYAWNGNRTDTTPQLHAQTYRFPSFPPVNSGWLKISLGQPNGIAISP